MDALSHFAIPYLLLWALGRPSRERIAAGLGGYAPDLDILLAPLARLSPQLYMLGHRGATHTLWGAPLAALALVLVLRAPFWARRWPRMAALRFGPRLALLAMAFSYAHLLLDWVTLWGAPLLWPWSMERFAARWVFSGIFVLVPVSAFVVVVVARGRATRRALRTSALLVVVLLVVTGGVRALTYPGEPEGGVTQPGPLDWQWVALAPEDGGWRATYYRWGEPVASVHHEDAAPAEGPAARALAQARETPEYRAFRFAAGGPVVASVERIDEGVWEVRFSDLLVEAETQRWPLTRFVLAGHGALRLVVEPPSVAAVER